jgi:hypothetical protein
MKYLSSQLAQTLLVREETQYELNVYSPFLTVTPFDRLKALREFNALSRVDTIPLTKYFLGGKMTQKIERVTSLDEGSGQSCDPLSSGGYALPDALPVGFRNFVKSTMNVSQQDAIAASASEYGDGGFTLIKGPPGKFELILLLHVHSC